MRDFFGKRILIAGLGKSGIAAFDALVRIDVLPAVYDARDIKEDAPELYEKLEALGAVSYLAGDAVPDETFDYLIMSPGVPLDLPFVHRAAERGAEIIGELELAWLLGKGRYVAITGTNGKTTTTTLVGEIFAEAGLETVVAGNIGTAVVSKSLDADDDTWLVTEVSSFQLETIKTFRPKIAAILNITPDHMDRHKTLENYTAVKARIFENQTDEDALVFNADDRLVADIAGKSAAKKIAFSRLKDLDAGASIKNGKIVFKDANRFEEVLDASDLKIPGAHNIENALAAVAISFAAGISPEVLAKTLHAFKGVEHRLEPVATIDGVHFINDSKGTNPDASVKAIEAIEGSMILIGGGYDKDADFEEYVRAAKDRARKLILMGATAEKIKACAEAAGIDEVYIAHDMDEAVRCSYMCARPGDTVLLSPACASWGMYDDYEQRGNHFKEVVRSLEGNNDQSSREI